MSLQSSVFRSNNGAGGREANSNADDGGEEEEDGDSSSDESGSEGSDDDGGEAALLSNLEGALSKMLVEKKAMKSKVSKEDFREWWRVKKPKVEAVLVEIGRIKGDLGIER